MRSRETTIWPRAGWRTMLETRGRPDASGVADTAPVLLGMDIERLDACAEQLFPRGC